MSTLKVNSIEEATAGGGTFNIGPQVVASFNGTGTVALYQDWGVSSLTDNSTGQYYITFSTNFSTATYQACSSSAHHQSAFWQWLSDDYGGGSQSNLRTTSICYLSGYSNGYVDSPSLGLTCCEAS